MNTRRLRCAPGVWRWAVLLLVLAAAACSRPEEQGLSMGIANAPVNLDPRYATDAASTRVNRLLYGRLVDFDDDSPPVPSLADWTVVTPTHYRFTLRSQRRDFSNGAPLTAHDVKATLDFILSSGNASPHRATLDLIRSIEVADDDRLDFHLHRPDLHFPAYLSIGILPARLIRDAHPFHAEPVGNGAFRFVAWPTSDRLVLKRRRDGQVLTFYEVKDPTVRVLKLLRGEIDMLQNDLPPELVAYLEQREEAQVQRRRGSNFSYIGFNLDDDVTGLFEVRRAIAHAIDRQAIIRHLLADAAVPAQALFPPGHWAGAKGLDAYVPDRERAAAWLARAGFGPDNPLRLTYKTSSDPLRVRIATVIQDQLRGIGVEVDVRSFDWGTFYGDIKNGRFQMYSLAWVGLKTPDVFRYVFHSISVPPQGANRGRYRSERADQLIDAAENSPGIEEQTALLQELQELLLADLPYIPLWYEDHLFAARRDVEGYRLAADGNYDGLASVRRRERSRDSAPGRAPNAE